MRIPNIEQKPRAVAETVTHYGYCAFKDIELGGPSGLEHNVQPADSPFYRKIPARMMVPFTNIPIHVIDEMKTKASRHGADVKWFTFNKSAKACVQEMTDSYAEWGFRIVEPLTGFSHEDVSAIFDVLQPFDYKLKDLVNEFNYEAGERINKTEPFEVSYDGETDTLQPLREDLKNVAREVLHILADSAERAFQEARKVEQKTKISMTKAFAGGDGKTVPDPHDKYIYDQLGVKPPELISSDKSEIGELAQVMRSNNESSDTLKLKELDIREREIAIEERKLELLEKEENRRKMEKVRAGKADS